VPAPEPRFQVRMMLANAWRGQNRGAEKRGEVEELVAEAEAALPAGHPTLAGLLDTLAAARLASRDLEGALEAQQRALAIAREVHGPRSDTAGVYQLHFARQLAFAKDFEAALAQMEEAVAILAETQGESDPSLSRRLEELEALRARAAR
jgi:hypothetical protein